MFAKAIKNTLLCAALGAVLFLQGCCCMHHKKNKADKADRGTTTEMKSSIPGETVPPPAMY